MKLRKKKGFTLVETVVVTLIVAMLSALLVTGIGTAIRIRSNELFASESELLASTLNTALGDVLHYSSYDGDEAGVPTFTNPGYGIFSGYLLVEDGRILISDRPASDSGAVLLTLTGGGAYTDLSVTSFTMSYENEIYTGSYDIQGSSPNQQKTITFAFRPING